MPNSNRPNLERLEDRTTPSTFLVLNGQDNGPGSLRQAIINANITPGVDTIHFNIFGDGPQIINLITELPPIVEGVIIDGTTQPGSTENTLPDGNNAKIGVQINGNGSLGLSFAGGLDNFSGTVIKGLSLTNFAGPAIDLRAVVAKNVTISGNYIGLEADGLTVAGNSAGVRIGQGEGVVVGGKAPADRNVIAGNRGDGVSVQLGQAKIIGNFIGTDRTGLVVAANSGAGVVLAGDNNEVLNNVISGNEGSGVRVDSGVNNVIRGNFIGTDWADELNLGNGKDGINVVAGSKTFIGGTDSSQANVVAFNAAAGIRVGSEGAAVVIGNKLHDNKGDTLTNNSPVLPPTLNSVQSRANGLTILGSLTGTPGTYLIDLYAASTANFTAPVRFGSATVTLDATQRVSFTIENLRLPAGRTLIRATATNLTTSQTSGYSATLNAAAGVSTSPPPATPTTPNESDNSKAPSTAPLSIPKTRLILGSTDGQVTTLAPVNGKLAVNGAAFQPFLDFKGTVQTAIADVNNDGVTDTIYATGPGGGARIRIIDGKNGKDLLRSGTFDAFAGENLTSIGINIAAGDIDGDGRAEIAVGPDQGGGPRVRVFTLSAGTLAPIADFFGIADDKFRGGVRLAMGDINGTGKADLVVAAGFGGGPRVAIFAGDSLTTTPTRLVNDFFAFEPAVRDGVYVSVGDLNGDGYAEVAFGAGPRGGPRVALWDGQSFANKSPMRFADDFFAGSSSERGGVRVLIKDVTGDNKAELVTGSGAGIRGTVSVFSASSEELSLTQKLEPFGSSNLTGGVFVG